MTKATTNLLDVLTEGRTLPEGHVWAIKTVQGDFTTRNGFTWPASGQAEAPGPIVEANTKPCPTGEGDGICVALTWWGMATGGIPAKTLLLCSIHNDDILGQDRDKLRVRRALIHDVIDGWSLIREHGRGADLRGANLTYANLTGADLAGADLTGANLTRANLTDADLRRAYLAYADLSNANLTGADLEGADLEGTDLSGVDLSGVDLSGVDLSKTDDRDW